MKQKSREDRIRDWFLEICPQAVISIRDLINDPSTPIASRVQLIGMVLDRALGKAETPLKVTTAVENMDMAEARLMEMIHEIQAEDEIVVRQILGKGGQRRGLAVLPRPIYGEVLPRVHHGLDLREPASQVHHVMLLGYAYAGCVEYLHGKSPPRPRPQ